jgi:hypothetical protein
MRTFALTLAALLAAPTAQAATYTLDFSGPICVDTSTEDPDDTGPCSNGSEISQTYGDQPGVDVVYDGSSSTDGNQGLLWWNDNYSDLQDIAFSASGSFEGGMISFLAGPSYEVALASLSLGGWPLTDRSLGFTITDLADDSVVVDEPIQTVSGSAASVFNFNVKSLTGLKITFLGDFFNGGVDNIVYSSTLVSNGPIDPVDPDPIDPSVIPLPASALLLLAGLGGLGALRRTKRSAD